MRYSIYFYDKGSKVATLDGHTDNKKVVLSTVKDLYSYGYKGFVKDFEKGETHCLKTFLTKNAHL